MASLISLRRPLTGLASRATRPHTLTPIAATSALLPRRFGTLLHTPRVTPRAGAAAAPPPKPVFAQSIRRNSDNSDNSGEPTLRKWGFEDINAALPSETASPTHSPQSKMILVDVREPAELTATGIIPSAVSVPLTSQPDALFLTADEFETRFGFPKPGEGQTGDVVFYCKAGVRARIAAQLAVQAGYDPARVGVYLGSWLDWAERGGRVEKWEGPENE
ncbi:hypothetical protein HFD88_004179 [Aspergillus terreus]|nr:hypothetical protein HFD88_004179 [Aspergillus terreus]